MMLHYLRQISDPDARRYGDLAGSRMLYTTDNLQYSRLACTVFPDKPDLVIFTYMEIDVIKQGKTAICDCKVVD